MYKYKSLIILFLILGNQQILRAQVVKGTVTDATTGKGIESAHIQFKNTSWVAVSDKQGKFVITDFQDSSRVVRITSIGYTPKDVVCESSHELQVLLEPSSLLLNNAVVVTAQRSEQISFDVMQSVTNLSQQEIANKQSRSTPEALMGEAGIWVQKTNHGSGSPIIRGLVGNQVLLMIDGIRMNNATYRYGPNQYLSTIDPGLVSSVETIRGSGSV
ncbi:MAG: TonB-dependent receptor, partial [Cyclobacteriaceae bacterium]|nr:TonB-dependent receptor [Cyclobacteriaceae bacterium]